LDAREDKAYDMHFNTDSSSSYVIKKPIDEPGSKSGNIHVLALSPKESGTNKYNTEKNTSFRIVLTHNYISIPQFIAAGVVVHSCPIPESYEYLFSRDINPPPPKSC
jgi:hypothetical protein